MVYFRPYWSHLDIAMTIFSHQMAALGFEPMTLGFLRLDPTHCAIGADSRMYGGQPNVVCYW